MHLFPTGGWRRPDRPDALEDLERGSYAGSA